MSETTTEYGTPKTVCDTEPFPPQTGDLLGGYIARLSARVRELEAASTEQSAYQRSLEDRIERLEAFQQAHVTRADVQSQIQDSFMRRLEQMEARLTPFHEAPSGAAAQAACPETTDITPENWKCVRCGKRVGPYGDDIENLCAECYDALHGVWAEAPAVTTPDEKPSEFMAGFDGKAIRESMNVPPVCATCGHGKGYHQHVMSPGTWCDSGTLGKPCQCREFTPVTTPTVTRERTHGRYGTRNLTKTKPDHIVDANKKVCATCGHPYNEHEIQSGKTFCYGGTLGKPCRCTEYKP